MTTVRTPAILQAVLAAVAVAAAATTWAKLPAPSDEAKAKAAESAAKTAHLNKVAGYKLCLSQNAVAARYMGSPQRSARPASAPVDTPPCVDPGPYVPAVAVAAASAPSTAGASAPSLAASAAPMTPHSAPAPLATANPAPAKK